jgi:hypothetical protein
MTNLNNLLFQIRYPYTAGVIATIWLGTAALLAIDDSLPLKQLVISDCIASIIIALLGFRTPRR